MKMRLVLVLCLMSALTVGVATATAGGGNSANAKLCQKGGWQILFQSTGGGFASEDACVAYGAQGGTISTTNPNPYPASNADCTAIGGTFSTDPSTDHSGNPGTFLWSCNGVALLIPQFTTLKNDCVNDAGTGWNFGTLTGNIPFYSCNRT